MEKKSIFLMIVILSLFYACSDSNDWVDQEQEKLLSVAQVELNLKSANGTTSKSYFEQGDQIGLHIYDSQGTGYRGLTYKNNSWILQTPVSLRESYTDIYATYPYNPENNVASSFEIEHSSQTDYLYSDMHSVNSSNPVLSLTMKHALALIEFEFEWMDFFQSVYLDFISIEGWNLHSRGKLDLLTGKMEHIEGWNEPAVVYGWQLNNNYLHDGAKVSLMVLPVDKVEYEGDIQINFYLGNLKAYWVVPSGTTWERGKKYTYKVVIKERMLEVMNILIEDWTDQGKEKIYLPWYE